MAVDMTEGRIVLVQSIDLISEEQLESRVL